MISEAGLRFIARHEGAVKNLAGFHVAYSDPAGNATIGYGHLLHKGPVTEEERSLALSEEQALELLRVDAQKAAEAVRGALKPEVYAWLEQHQLDALGSWFFNLGWNPATGQSTLIQLINSPVYWRGVEGKRFWPDLAIKEEFSKWVLAGGKVMPGLVVRRQNEATLWNAGLYL